MANKVLYGLKDVHYAVVTETTTNGVTTSTYGQVKAWPGAVNMSLSAEGSDDPFFADDGVYFTASSNNGYSGDFVSALIPEDVQLAVYGQTKDANGVITETSDDVKKYIALMFQFTGDASGRRYVFYRCMLTRSNVEGSTKGDSVEVKTNTVTITASPRPDDNKVKAFCEKESAAYATFYNAVYGGVSSPAGISIAEQVLNLTAGDTYTLGVTVLPAGATITWTSSDSEKASVAAGVVTAEGAGNAIITASITDSGVTYTSTCTVIVAAA